MHPMDFELYIFTYTQTTKSNGFEEKYCSKGAVRVLKWSLPSLLSPAARLPQTPAVTLLDSCSLSQ